MAVAQSDSKSFSDHSDSDETSPRQKTTFCLARPAISSSAIALQVQRLSADNDVSILYDLKEHTALLKRLAKKIKSIHSVVGVFKPSLSHRHDTAAAASSGADGDSTQPPPTTLSTSGQVQQQHQQPSLKLRIRRGSNTSAKVYSVYDRDTPNWPAALLSKHGVSFSVSATPLLTPNSQLSRAEITSNPNSGSGATTNTSSDPAKNTYGPVTWIVCETKSGGFNIVDKSTQVVLGRWRRGRGQKSTTLQLKFLDCITATFKKNRFVNISHPQRLDELGILYLDEFVRKLRQKHGLEQKESPVDSDEDGEQSTMQEPPTSPTTGSSPVDTSLRFQLVDAIIMTAASVMLHLEENSQSESAPAE